VILNIDHQGRKSTNLIGSSRPKAVIGQLILANNAFARIEFSKAATGNEQIFCFLVVGNRPRRVTRPRFPNDNLTKESRQSILGEHLGLSEG
jgi:hypothetical protein